MLRGKGFGQPSSTLSSMNPESACASSKLPNSRFPGGLAEAGHTRVPRVSVSRSILALMNETRSRLFRAQDEAIAEADTLLLTVPNKLALRITYVMEAARTHNQRLKRAQFQFYKWLIINHLF